MDLLPFPSSGTVPSGRFWARLEMLAHFVEDARAMSRAVCWGDAASVEDTVERGRKIRRGSIELKQAWVRRSRDRWWSGHTTNLIVVSFG